MLRSIFFAMIYEMALKTTSPAKKEKSVINIADTSLTPRLSNQSEIFIFNWLIILFSIY